MNMGKGVKTGATLLEWDQVSFIKCDKKDLLHHLLATVTIATMKTMMSRP